MQTTMKWCQTLSVVGFVFGKTPQAISPSSARLKSLFWLCIPRMPCSLCCSLALDRSLVRLAFTYALKSHQSSLLLNLDLGLQVDKFASLVHIKDSANIHTSPNKSDFLGKRTKVGQNRVSVNASQVAILKLRIVGLNVL